MSTATWLVLGGVVWCVASVALAVVIGRAAVRRERQKPRPLRNTGWGPFPMPGEKRRMDVAAEQVRTNPPAGPRKGEQR